MTHQRMNAPQVARKVVEGRIPEELFTFQVTLCATCYKAVVRLYI